jgi:hypothetical protein
MVTVKADHIAGIGKGEPQRTNNFYVEFSRVVPGTKLFVSGVSFPGYSANVSELRQGNLMMKYVESVSYGDIQLTIYDIIDEDIASQLAEWWALVTDERSQEIRSPQEYKEELEIGWVDGCGGTPRSWKLEGCLPREINFGQANMAAPGPVEIQVTISVDNIVKN